MTDKTVRALAPPYPIQPHDIDTETGGRFLFFCPHSRKRAVAAMCTLAWFVVKICQSKHGWQPITKIEVVLELLEANNLLALNETLLTSLLTDKINYIRLDDARGIMVTPEFVKECYRISPKKKV